jgi:secondary thiamine-phosphate synthase enzyme
MLKEFVLQTHDRIQMIPIDREVESAVLESGIREGTCLVWVPHTTAGVTVNENADPSVVQDILSAIGKTFPVDGRFHHLEGNSDAHIKSSLFGPSLSLIVTEGKPLLGTWQSVYFCEFDGPRRRRFYVKLTESG